MYPSSSLFTATITVLDASSLISVVSMPCVNEILTQLRNPSVAKQVQSEFRRWPGSNRPLLKSDWRAPPLREISVLTLADSHADYFTELVLECGLGDGEAASLALVHHLPQSILICDDAKAVRDGRERSPALQCLSTVGLLRIIYERGVLVSSEISDALRASLRDSRLRVSASDFLWVRQFLDRPELESMPSIRRLLRCTRE